MAKAKKANQGAAAPATTSKGRKFATVRNVTLPLLRIEIEQPVYVTVRDEMRVSAAKNRKKAGDGKDMEPATVVTVADIDPESGGGEIKTMIVSAAVKSIWDEEYPNGAYVGKSFCLVKHAKKEGKNYFNFSVDEIDPEQPQETAP